MNTRIYKEGVSGLLYHLDMKAVRSLYRESCINTYSHSIQLRYASSSTYLPENHGISVRTYSGVSIPRRQDVYKETLDIVPRILKDNVRNQYMRGRGREGSGWGMDMLI